MDEKQAEEFVGRLKAHFEELRKQYKGQPLSSDEILANTVFWGSVLTHTFPELVGVAEQLIAGSETGVAYVQERDKITWN